MSSLTQFSPKSSFDLETTELVGLSLSATTQGPNNRQYQFISPNFHLTIQVAEGYPPAVCASIFCSEAKRAGAADAPVDGGRLIRCVPSIATSSAIEISRGTDFEIYLPKTFRGTDS